MKPGDRGGAILAQMPNGLSALRFALAAVWIELAAHGHQGRIAFAIVAIVAAGSDFIDGPSRAAARSRERERAMARLNC